MAADVGLKTSPGDPALDQLYVERLLGWIQESTLEQAVILACDDLYDETGHPFPGLSGLFVPNDYVLEFSRRHPEFLPAVPFSRCGRMPSLNWSVARLPVPS
jgi:hypothetical protein